MFASSRVSRFVRIRPPLLSAAMALTCMAGALAPPLPAYASLQTRNPEDLLIVDCLLPGQVRRLGAASTYMSARRPVRTTQADCEIRGGEFVAQDRANYQTALKVWQGQAELGDADAQNYVGEIYLKGLGTTPDYAKAAGWFEKAAAQNSRRARINLGYMYEQGMGVARDLPRALNLYRDASGISGDQLVFASSVSSQIQQAQAESENLREQLSGEQQKSEQLRAQVDQLRKQLQQKQQTYDQTRRELNETRGKLDAEQTKLGVDHDPKYAKLKADQEAQEKTLANQQHELETARQSNAKQLADAQAEIARLNARQDELKKQGTSGGSEIAQLRASVAKMDDALTQSRQKMQDLQDKLTQNEQQSQAEQAKFDEARVALAKAHSENDDSTRLLKLMEAQLIEKRQQLANQRAQMTSLRAKVDAGDDTRTASTAPPSSYSTASLAGGLRVEILQPALSGTRGSAQPAASVPASEEGMDIVGRVLAPAGLTQLSINDQSVVADAGGVFKTHVALIKDGTSVHVAALDKHGEKAMLDFMLLPGPGNGANAAAGRGQTVNTLPRGVQLGKFHALIIGNDNYTSYPGLKSASADATAIAGLLKSHYGYDVHLVTNANRFEMLSALNDMREQLKDDDNLLVYYAGHGEVDKAREGYWLPVDAQTDRPTGWISNRAVSDILTTMNAKHVLVIADSCYSGTMTRSSLATFGGMAPNAWGDWVKTMVAGRSRTALTSGGVQPVADAAQGEHSIFAGALLAVLNQNNQLLTGQRLFREIAASMALRGTNAALQQAPEYAPIQFAGHEAGEFFFLPHA